MKFVLLEEYCHASVYRPCLLGALSAASFAFDCSVTTDKGHKSSGGSTIVEFWIQQPPSDGFPSSTTSAGDTPDLEVPGEDILQNISSKNQIGFQPNTLINTGVDMDASRAEQEISMSITDTSIEDVPTIVDCPTASATFCFSGSSPSDISLSDANEETCWAAVRMMYKGAKESPIDSLLDKKLAK